MTVATKSDIEIVDGFSTDIVMSQITLANLESEYLLLALSGHRTVLKSTSAYEPKTALQRTEF